ncbi:MAG: agmatinase [Saprospiraceae bacterium]|nr:agmatinase [Saprospiraceae bacterium]
MIKLLGVPFDANSSFLRGPALAPQHIRLMDREGSANRFSEDGSLVAENETYQDMGDIHFEDTNPERAFNAIKSTIANLLKDGTKVLSIGGDHSVSYPIISAFTGRYEGLNVLHLDAHGDLYPSFDDNPYSHASPFARLLEEGKINSLTQVGLRSLTEVQRAQIRKYGTQLVEMKDFKEDFLKDLQGPLYISLDLDVLDPAYAPGVSHHEPGGMTSRQLLKIVQSIHVEVGGADIVEYNPVRDINNMTAMVGYKMMKELMVKMAQ